MSRHKRKIDYIDSTNFTPLEDGLLTLDYESAMEIVEKLNEVIAYINNKEREEKQK